MLIVYTSRFVRVILAQGPRGKSSSFLPDAVAFGCSAFALLEQGAHLSPAAFAAGAGAVALA